MTEKNIKSNILIILSLVFFLVSTAFTISPGYGSSESEALSFGCYTCTLDGGGAPTGCADAQFCGMSSCSGECDGGGSICGECEGD